MAELVNLIAGRIAYRLDCPPVLPISDLAAIAAYHIPEAGEKIIDVLCDYAHGSGKYLAGIETVAKRARFLAKKAGQAVPDKSIFIAKLGSNTPLLAAFDHAKIAGLKRLSFRNLSADGGQVAFVNRARPTKKIPRLLVEGSSIPPGATHRSPVPPLSNPQDAWLLETIEKRRTTDAISQRWLCREGSPNTRHGAKNNKFPFI